MNWSSAATIAAVAFAIGAVACVGCGELLSAGGDDDPPPTPAPPVVDGALEDGTGDGAASIEGGGVADAEGGGGGIEACDENKPCVCLATETCNFSCKKRGGGGASECVRCEAKSTCVVTGTGGLCFVQCAVGATCHVSGCACIGGGCP